MTKLYLIRHAEAEGNLYRIAQGQYNSIITDRGWRQIRALERRFQDIHVDAVYASDLYRTCATASAIYRPKGLELHRRRDLREICVGVWEQKTWARSPGRTRCRWKTSAITWTGGMWRAPRRRSRSGTGCLPPCGRSPRKTTERP
ncbi:MAG: histidine phosphatase family protein [Dysosmobacter sp.]